MVIKKTNYESLKITLAFLVFLLFFGCAAGPKKFDPNIKGSQMIVAPAAASIGIAKLLSTDITFRGQGFQPNDSVFIKLMGVKKGDQTIDIPIADGNVDTNGNFKATVEKLVKITEFLRANVTLNDQMETVVVISQPPMPTGNYKIRAESMESNLKAECDFKVKSPSIGDKLKDMIGGFLGKIKKEEKKK